MVNIVGEAWTWFVSWLTDGVFKVCVCGEERAIVAVRPLSIAMDAENGMEMNEMKATESTSPQTVMELEQPVPLSRCFREPTSARSSNHVRYRQHLVELHQTMSRAYCRAFDRKAFNTNSGSSVNHVSEHMAAHCGAAVQDPQGVILSATMMLRLIYPPHWAFDSEKYWYNDLVLCVALLALAFKMQSSLQAATGKPATERPGWVLEEIIAHVFGKNREFCQLRDVKKMEARLVSGELEIFTVCHENPLALAERELENLFLKRCIQTREQQAVIRGMLAFFVHAALLNPDEDVLEKVGLRADAVEMAKGLVSVALTCYAAGQGMPYKYDYGKRVNAVAYAFALQACRGPAGYLRVGPYSVGKGPSAAWSTAVRDAVSRKTVHYALEVFDESEAEV